MNDGLLYRDEYYKIVNAAIKVWKYHGYGLRENNYENSLIIELRKRGFRTQQQAPYRVFYEEEPVGDYKIDLIFENIIVLELKSCEAICDEHVSQTLTYLKVSGLRLGIILNFGPKCLEHRRVVF